MNPPCPFNEILISLPLAHYVIMHDTLSVQSLFNFMQVIYQPDVSNEC